jgi:hypothetical protein
MGQSLPVCPCTSLEEIYSLLLLLLLLLFTANIAILGRSIPYTGADKTYNTNALT